MADSYPEAHYTQKFLDNKSFKCSCCLETINEHIDTFDKNKNVKPSKNHRKRSQKTHDKTRKLSTSYMIEKGPIYQINKELLKVNLKKWTTQQKKINKGHQYTAHSKTQLVNIGKNIQPH